MNRVVKILMERDGITREEAEKLIEETREEILEGSPWGADEVIAANLGLEPDYIMDIL